MEGASVLRCNGSDWVNPRPRCVYLPATGCGVAPWVENAEIVNMTFVNRTSDANDYITFKCNNGFTTYDEKTVICTRDGRWTRIPSCYRKNCYHPPSLFLQFLSYYPIYFPAIRVCDYPPIVNHGRVIKKTYDQFPTAGNNATYMCYNNYVMNGSDTINCNADFKWSQPPRCSESEGFFCPDIEKVNNSLIDATTYTNRKPRPGDTAVFRCNPGFRLFGPSMVRCLISLRWSLKPRCIRLEKPKPTLQMVEGVLPLNYTTTPKPDGLFCSKPKSIDRAVSIAKSFTDTAKSGDIVVYKCEDGYERAPGSSKSLLCVGGEWIGLIKCQPDPKSCVPPLTIENANILSRSFSGNRGMPVSCFVKLNFKPVSFFFLLPHCRAILSNTPVQITMSPLTNSTLIQLEPKWQSKQHAMKMERGKIFPFVFHEELKILGKCVTLPLRILHWPNK